MRSGQADFPMPTYEYTCKNCGERLEIFQKFTDKPLKTHPECGGELKKVLHASGIVFKGSGFYATDKRGSSAKTSSSDGSKDKPKKAKDSPKADTATTAAAD